MKRLEHLHVFVLYGGVYFHHVTRTTEHLQVIDFYKERSVFNNERLFFVERIS